MKKLIYILTCIIMVMACFILYEENTDFIESNTENSQPDMQAKSESEITSTESTIETTVPKEEQAKSEVKDTSTKTTVETKAPKEEQSIDTNKEVTTLSKDEITSGHVSISLVGGTNSHTFSSEELEEFIDSFNSFNITEEDREGEHQIHTTLDDSIDVLLMLNNGTKISFMAFSDGEIYFTDENNNFYPLFNEELSNYFLGLDKYLFTVETQ